MDDLEPFDPHAAVRASICLARDQADRLRRAELRACRLPEPRSRVRLRLDTPVKFLKGIGERRAEQLERLGIRTARDLLWHLPHRYLDASTVTPLAKAEVGAGGGLRRAGSSPRASLPTRRGLRIFHAVLRDDSGVLECVWPGQAFLDRSIEVGQTLLVSGPVRFYHGRQMAPREFVILADAGSDDDEPLAAGKVLPVYPATEGLSHKIIRALIDRHLDALIACSPRHPAGGAAPELELPPLAEALRAVHRPRRAGGRRAGTAAAGVRRAARPAARCWSGRAPSPSGSAAGSRSWCKRDLTTRLKRALPWELTDDQQQRAARDHRAT